MRELPFYTVEPPVRQKYLHPEDLHMCPGKVSYIRATHTQTCICDWAMAELSV